ncbi:MAG: DegT/DnrJ/EryC1/StrS family aminotransferase [archaeon]|nr:DegT/DnrJ/EryC1/StrS family aminotransferase [archaeon]
MKTEKNGPGNKIPIYEPWLCGNELKYLTECVKSSWVSSTGPFVDKFEKDFASYIGAKNAVSTMNGTVALHLALAAFGIGKGDEVIVPNFTFVASASSVRHANATPVLADIDPQTLNILPDDIEKKITSRTKAIMPVHLYGRPAPMKEIMEIAQKHGLVVIEDAAEAHGASIGNKKVGSIGHAGVFSFYGNKIMTTGEGGMLLTNDAKIAERAWVLKNHGAPRNKRYWQDEVGYNYRMTNMQAALGLAQLERVEEIISRKRKIAAQYNSLLSEKGLVVPSEEKGTRNVYWLNWLMAQTEESKTKIEKGLELAGIETRPFFYPLSIMPPFKGPGFPNSLSIYRRGLCLPSHPTLTSAQVERIAAAINP